LTLSFRRDLHGTELTDCGVLLRSGRCAVRRS